MNQDIAISRIDNVRSNARHIVRELGFMQKGLAGTELSPSAVHTLIELGNSTVSNASALGELLHLEKSSVSRLVQKLEDDGLIEVRHDPRDKRSRVLSLTEVGDRLREDIEDYARQQLGPALNALSTGEIGQIEAGLALFAKALNARSRPVSANAKDVVIHQGYRSGMIASVTLLHATYYSENYGFGAIFEQKVATEMSEFMARIDKPMNTAFSAYLGRELLGSVSLDGEDLDQGICHLRWFIVSPKAQGLGIGNLLISKATDFLDHHNFDRTRLWTFKGLDAARHLYEKHGFSLVHETPGIQWGTEVIEQEFAR